MRKPFIGRQRRLPMFLIIGLCGALLAGLLSGCDKSIDERLAAQAAAEKTLAISPQQFATRFNRTVGAVLEDRHDDQAAHMAPLYVIDVTHLAQEDYRYVFKSEVGPSRTSIIGSLSKDGDLRGVGVLLTQRSEGARDEFYLCAETIGRVLTSGANGKLPDLIRRLSNNALNNPGQRMEEVIGDKVLSAQIVSTGLLFQIERQQ